MRLDIRVPVGFMFATIGALLTGYGVLGDQSIYARSLGINVNLMWGLVMLAAAACFLILSARESKRNRGRS
jgi:hypothetical protein